VPLEAIRGLKTVSELWRTVKYENIDLKEYASRKGNCWDNAAMKSFFATLKKELVHHEESPTRAAAQHSLFECIEVFL
jgi:putative transposase